MLSELLNNPKGLAVSLVLHAILIGLIVVNLDFFDKPKQIKAGQIPQSIKAEVVDTKQLEQNMRVYSRRFPLNTHLVESLELQP